MTVFTVNGNEIFGFDELQDKFLFFLAGVPGDVNSAGGIVVVDKGAAAKHVVEHAEDGFFVSGDDAGGEDDGIVFIDGDEAVIINGDAGERRHGFGLAAAGENEQALGGEAAHLLGANDHAVRDAE